MRPPLVRRKLIPLAQSIAEPPPRPTRKSMPWLPATRRPAAAGPRAGVAGGEVGGGGVWPHGAEDEGDDPRRAQHLQRPLRVAGVLESGVGDEQNAPAAVFAHQLPEPGEGAGPEDDPRQRVVVEGRR